MFNGISFIIITNGKKNDITLTSIDSIKNTMRNGCSYEIIISGDIEKFKTLEGVSLLDYKNLAATGNLSAMRNRGAESAKYEILFILDDDVVLEDTWYSNFKEYAKNNVFDVYACRFLLPDGGRYWDKAVLFDSYQTLVDYDHDATDRNLYQTGGLLIIKKDVFLKIKFNEDVLYYNSNSAGCDVKVNEDVDFSRRLYGSGYCINFDKNNIVYHLDNSIFSNGTVVCRKTELNEQSTTQNTKSRYEYIYDLYKTCLNRAPDSEGLRSYLFSELSVEQIKNALTESDEFKKANTKEIANFFWHGNLTALEKACIKSFINNGFQVRLWSYTNEHVEGTQSCDARIILPESELDSYCYTNTHTTEHVSNIAAFSDIFRLLVIARFGGWWFDTDCYCLVNSNTFKIARSNTKFVAGFESMEEVNTAALFISSEYSHILLNQALRMCKLHDNKFDKWGTIGPLLLKRFLLENNEWDNIRQQSDFYAIHYDEANLLIDPQLKDVAKERVASSMLMHLWDSLLIGKYKIDKNNPPVGSLLEEIIRKHAFRPTN